MLQQSRKRGNMCFADGREPKFVLGIMLLDEVVSKLMGEGKEPGFDHLIFTGRDIEMEHTTISEPAASRLSEHPCRLVRPVSVLYFHSTGKGTLTPCFKISQVKEDASVPIECNRSSGDIIENM